MLRFHREMYAACFRAGVPSCPLAFSLRVWQHECTLPLKALHDPQLCTAPFLGTGFSTGWYGVKPYGGLWAGTGACTQDRQARIEGNLRAVGFEMSSKAGVTWPSGRTGATGVLGWPSKRLLGACESLRTPM